MANFGFRAAIRLVLAILSTCSFALAASFAQEAEGASASELCGTVARTHPPVSEPWEGSLRTDVAVMVEGDLVSAGLCVVLEGDSGSSYELEGDLQGFGPGDHVIIEGKEICSFNCASVCATGLPILEVVSISGVGVSPTATPTPDSVGGVAALPHVGEDAADGLSRDEGGGVTLPLAVLFIGLGVSGIIGAAVRLARGKS